MAVEATHLNPFPPRIMIQNRGLMNPMNQANGNQMRFIGFPSPETQCFVPAGKTFVQTDGGAMCDVEGTRKRSIDAVNQYSFDLPQIQQNQTEIDVIISQYTKRMKLELESRHKQHARLLAAAISVTATKKLKEKDETIHKMVKLNLFLQDRVRNLYVENQLLRDLAQSNEAAANSLRRNIEQALLNPSVAGKDDDVESCCSSSSDAVEKGEEGEGRNCYSDRRCRRCGDRESSVLLLPCRHVSLCSVCGSGSQQLQACPACHSSVTATLHVNLSS